MDENLKQAIKQELAANPTAIFEFLDLAKRDFLHRADGLLGPDKTRWERLGKTLVRCYSRIEVYGYDLGLYPRRGD